jgi:hypothetical protein
MVGMKYTKPALTWPRWVFQRAGARSVIRESRHDDLPKDLGTTGRGFSYPEITRVIQFAQLFSDEAIVVTLSQELSWPHFRALPLIRDALARTFYSEMCRKERRPKATQARPVCRRKNGPALQMGSSALQGAATVKECLTARTVGKRQVRRTLLGTASVLRYIPVLAGRGSN